MGSCLQSVSLNTCTMGKHTALDPRYTLWAAVFKVYPLNTCTMHAYTLKTAEAHNVYTTGYTCLLDIHSTVDTGYTFYRTVDTGYT